MKLRTLFTTSILFILLLASCNEKEEKKQHALPAPMEEIDTTNIKKSLLREVKNYVNQYDSCNTFLLFPTFFYKLNNDQEYYYDYFPYNEIFCIGKISSASFGHSEFRLAEYYPHRYFKIGKKYIFLSSRDDILYDQMKLKAIIDSMVPRGFRDVLRRELLIYTLKDSCVVHPEDSTNNIRFLFHVSEKFTAPDI